ncbi:MAG TPA: DTW domain-containing protein [Planctomycetes bacterium]|nr:DTW domain-containing protein [Planctomycetota bacterium]
MTSSDRFRLIVLRHPREAKSPLGTADLLVREIPDTLVRTGLSWPNLQAASGDESVTAAHWGVLFVGTKADRKRLLLGSGSGGGRRLVFLSRKGKAVEDDTSLRESLEGLVLLDGTWRQSKALWWRNPWLLRLRRVMLNPDAPSLYGKLRREPRRECLSTFEAAILALRELGRVQEPSVFFEALKAHLDGLAGGTAGPRRSGTPRSDGQDRR